MMEQPITRALIEHREHRGFVEDCPYCLDRLRASGEIEQAEGGIFCVIHGEMNCTEPSCWRCGNHLIGPEQRCTDPACRALNDEAAQEIARTYPGEIEIIALRIAERRLGRKRGPSELPPTASFTADG